jgi:protein involved in polysaccharide export with SLBB domain
MHMVNMVTTPSMALRFFCCLLALGSLAFAQAAAEPKATPATSQASHVLAASELIEIKVFQEPDLDTTVRIPEDGRIVFPLIGEVILSGKTVQEATRIIHDRLQARFLVNPQVSMTVTEQAKRLFTVLGQVQHPGTYRFPERQNLDLLQVIGIAGGYTRLADPSRIRVKRQADGKVFRIDGNRLAKGGADAFAIVAGDLITVEERLF